MSLASSPLKLRHALPQGSVAVTCAVALTLGVLLLPLPTALLDLVWGALLAASVLVVLWSLRVAGLAQATRFPTLLLVTSLLRLTLCIASLRALLLHGSPSALVQGMGALLAGSNPWVEASVFLSLLIAQLLVTVRGNERLAEIRARFALDALPGRQLSIDADLRSGAIHAFEAQRRRGDLATESEIFGALDGAMKFVRGEQIALIAIVILGVVAGCYLGFVDQSLPLAQALRRASVASLGIGLVAQLSAFALAVATGLLMTKVGSGEGAQRGEPVVAPWSLRVSPELDPLLPRLEQLSERLRVELQHELGLMLPACKVVADRELPAGQAALWIRTSRVMSCQADAQLEQVTIQLQGALRRHAAELIGIGETQALLSDLDTVASATALQVVPKLVSLVTLTDVLRRLLAEQVSIGDLKAILEALANVSGSASDPATLTELVRPQLKRAITQRYLGPERKLSVLLLEPQLEMLLHSSVTSVKGVTTLILSPAATRDFTSAVQSAVAKAASTAAGATLVLIARGEVRRFVRELLEVDLPDLPVVAPSELLPEVELQAVGTISVSSL